MAKAADDKDKDKAKDGQGKGRKPSSPIDGGKSPTAQRHAKRREEKLKEIREQVADGSLVIREMTAEERKKYPPKPRTKGKGGRGRGRAKG